MADHIGSTPTSMQLGDGHRTQSHVVEAYVPPSGWTEDSDGRHLLIDLPGFKKEEVRLELVSTGHIIISGERLVGAEKCVFFEQNFPLPEDSDVDNISGKIDGEILYISVPKKQGSPDEKEEHHPNSIIRHDTNVDSSSEEDEAKDVQGGSGQDVHACTPASSPVAGFTPEAAAGFTPGAVKKWAKEQVQLEEAIKLLKDNKGMILALVLAFSLGVYVSQTFGTGSTA